MTAHNATRGLVSGTPGIIQRARGVLPRTRESVCEMSVKLKIENAVATVTLDRPEKMNALSEDM